MAVTFDEAVIAGLIQVGSREEELDRAMDEIIGKMVRGGATEDDKAQLWSLQRERVERMAPRRPQSRSF